jgi:DNA-binding protein H-NS
MTKTYAQLQKQIQSPQGKAEQMRHQEIKGVIGRIKDAIKVYDLSAADLGLANGAQVNGKVKRGRRSAVPKVGAPKAVIAVKFRDEAGNTWGGHGPRPQWLRDALASGRDLTDFAV